MKISVIVPYEGYYQYLKDCLESLSEQENVEIETLLVGSQDDQKFQQLVDTYKDKISLNVIPCSIEEGVAKKRNLGLEQEIIFISLIVMIILCLKHYLVCFKMLCKKI